MINILYFAGLREALGTARESILLPVHVTTLQELRNFLAQRPGPWVILRERQDLQMALNQSLSSASSTLRDGDEVAFFPPVTGG